MPFIRAANRVDTLMQGKNLDVVTRYARKSPVVLVRVRASVESVGRTILDFEYDDGAYCVTYWNDWRVAVHWINARRSWSLDRVLICDGMYPQMAQELPQAVAALRKRGTSVIEIGGRP